MRDVKDMLSYTDLDVQAVENCSMETEKKYRSPEEIPDDAGYLSLIIAKDNKEINL
jgi:precorrin-2/cobalt-factor-2 C20-methyltransferase